MAKDRAAVSDDQAVASGEEAVEQARVELEHVVQVPAAEAAWAATASLPSSALAGVLECVVGAVDGGSEAADVQALESKFDSEDSDLDDGCPILVDSDADTDPDSDYDTDSDSESNSVTSDGGSQVGNHADVQAHVITMLAALHVLHVGHQHAVAEAGPSVSSAEKADRAVETLECTHEAKVTAVSTLHRALVAKARAAVSDDQAGVSGEEEQARVELEHASQVPATEAAWMASLPSSGEVAVQVEVAALKAEL